MFVLAGFTGFQLIVQYNQLKACETSQDKHDSDKIHKARHYNTFWHYLTKTGGQAWAHHGPMGVPKYLLFICIDIVIPHFIFIF
jgi:hypothetical protein